MISRAISVAPMMGWTDRHARYFLRLITKHTLLYTEMVNTGALLHNRQKVGEQKRFLAYHASEHPLALQLGAREELELPRIEPKDREKEETAGGRYSGISTTALPFPSSSTFPR